MRRCKFVPRATQRASAAAVDPVGQTAIADLQQRMSYRQQVAKGQCVGSAAALLDRDDLDLLVSEAKIDQQAKDVGLKTKAVSVRVPTHNIMAQVYRKT